MPITCMVEMTDSYVANLDGVIYKCPGFIGKKDFEAGDLQTGVKDYRDSYRPGIWKNEDCARCEYLPLCLGGCRYMTFLRHGVIDRENAYTTSLLRKSSGKQLMVHLQLEFTTFYGLKSLFYLASLVVALSTILLFIIEEESE